MAHLPLGSLNSFHWAVPISGALHSLLPGLSGAVFLQTSQVAQLGCQPYLKQVLSLPPASYFLSSPSYFLQSLLHSLKSSCLLKMAGSPSPSKLGPFCFLGQVLNKCLMTKQMDPLDVIQ